MKKTLALAAVGLLALASTAAADVETYTCTDCGMSKGIPAVGTSGDMAPSIITVAGDDSCGEGRAKIFDVNVGINYRHTWNSDLTVRLSSPDSGDGAVSLELFSGVGGSSDNMNVVLDDQSEAGPLAGAVNDGSSRQPQNGPILCNFNGMSAVGDWQLDINDQFGGDSGWLNDWFLEVDCQVKGKAPQCADGGGKGGRGLGSWANNGRGNGEDLPPPGQRGR